LMERLEAQEEEKLGEACTFPERDCRAECGDGEGAALRREFAEMDLLILALCNLVADSCRQATARLRASLTGRLEPMAPAVVPGSVRAKVGEVEAERLWLKKFGFEFEEEEGDGRVCCGGGGCGGCI